MGIHKIVMPDIGEGVTEAEITEWNVKVGDAVREDDLIAEVMTDKATIEIPSPVDGTVAEISGEVGEVIPVGTVIVTLDIAGSEQLQAQTGSSAANPTDGEASAPMEKEKADRVVPATSKHLAPPVVRRRAKEAGIDLADVSGSGPDGRILLSDLDAWPGSQQSGVGGNSTRLEGIKEIRVIGLRRKIAEHMQAATRHMAHMTYVEEIDVTELETLRGNLNSDLSADKTRLTLLPFFITAIIRALKENPKFNAHFDDKAGIIRQFESVHMGVATQTSEGLVVPVINRADTLDLWKLAREVTRLAEAAKSGDIKREELTGSTITLSSLGSLGGLVSTPIINAPEVAVIGVNKIATRPVWIDTEFLPRKIMNLSSSFDHRVVDGWDAALFIRDVKALIENPSALLEEVKTTQV